MDKLWIGMVIDAVLMFAIMRGLEILTILFPWKRAYMCGGNVTLWILIGMRMRGCPPAFLIDAYCALLQAKSQMTMHKWNPAKLHINTNFPTTISATLFTCSNNAGKTITQPAMSNSDWPST